MANDTFDAIRSRFSKDSLENGPRRVNQIMLLIILGFSGAAVITVGLFMSADSGEKETDPASVVQNDLTLHPERAQRQAFISQQEARLDNVEKQLRNIQSAVLEIGNTYQTTLSTLAGKVNVQAAAIEGLQRGQMGWEDVRKRVLAQEEAAAAAAAESREHATDPAEAWDPSRLDAATGSVPWEGSVTGTDGSRAAPGGGRLAMVTLPVPQDTRRIPQRRYQVEPLYRPDVPIDVNRAEGLDAENYIPAGSFTKSTLLTGAYASTGGAAGSAPMPVLMKLNDLAVLPNRWRAAVKDCHVTGHATGDISSERVLIRLDRLACVGPKGQILDIRVSGYAVGPDGKVGIRAKLVTRSGQAIAAAISTGVISGISKSLSLSTQQISTSTLTGTQTVDFGNSALVGFGEAFSSAANRLMDYYLDLADKIMPVLELEAGIPLDLVFSRGTPLSSES